jgi:hypothetical protein
VSTSESDIRRFFFFPGTESSGAESDDSFNPSRSAVVLFSFSDPEPTQSTVISVGSGSGSLMSQ